MMVVVMMMVVMRLAKRGRSGNHRKEQYSSKNLLHSGHPSMASIAGSRMIPPPVSR
jgi:hypothetical protein